MLNTHKLSPENVFVRLARLDMTAIFSRPWRGRKSESRNLIPDEIGRSQKLNYINAPFGNNFRFVFN
jgi:hypothetical protein